MTDPLCFGSGRSFGKPNQELYNWFSSGRQFQHVSFNNKNGSIVLHVRKRVLLKTEESWQCIF